MAQFNVLVVGSGGREHALAWKLAQSDKVNTVFVAPGNAGTATEEKCQNLSIQAGQFEELSDFALNNNVELTVIGPEAPLVEGVVDHFQSHKLKCFGPSAAAAQLEGSKAFTKDFLQRHSIPTADYQSFTETDAALAYVREQGTPIVVKADGLAAGKGVVVAETLEEAEKAVESMLEGNQFGDAGHRVVIEEFLQGEEASFIVMSDGVNVLPMATSQDHKRIGDNDTGPNTGGMGAYSPAPVVDAKTYSRIMDEVIMPTIKGMAAEGNTYAGFLYAGLMITAAGEPKVIEYNCRFGDPETQPIMMRLESDLAELCLAALDKSLDRQTATWNHLPAIGVVLAAEGYPGDYKKGIPIQGLESNMPGRCKIFHAGTAVDNGTIVTAGGRVLCVTALAESFDKARAIAYECVGNINWPGVQYRRDIGYRAIGKL